MQIIMGGIGLELSWLESLLLGFVSGLTEILPVSAQAHRVIMMKIFGMATDSGMLRLLTHGAVLLALMNCNRPLIHHLRRDLALSRIPKRRRKRQPDAQSLMTVRLIRSCALWMCLGILLRSFAAKVQMNLPLLAFFWIVNGIILYIPQFLPLGNKDIRSMTRFDSFLFGVSAAVSFIPGISLVGSVASAGLGRGADRNNSLNWSMLLMMPALAVLMCFDAYAIISCGAGGFGIMMLLKYIISAAAAYVGTSAAVYCMRFLAVKTGFSGFAYYSWGAALFTFILFLAS